MELRLLQDRAKTTGNFLITDVHQDDEGLVIQLKDESDESKTLTIKYRRYYLYQNIDETGRTRMWIKSKFEDPKWQFCTSTNSNLISWLIDESNGIYEDRKMIHYLIKTDTHVLDIISNTAPEVSLL